VDEVSPWGATRVAELRDGEIRRYELSPEELGLEPADLGAVAGGDPADNAATIEAVLAGENGAPRTAVVANAAAALLVSGKVSSWAEGARLAERILDEGKAAEALARLREASERAAST
jgi:anthranilate phosphoribosyltransferase